MRGEVRGTSTSSFLDPNVDWSLPSKTEMLEKLFYEKKYIPENQRFRSKFLKRALEDKTLNLRTEEVYDNMKKSVKSYSDISFTNWK